jgi:multicomponent Na+:H+ antiporter subunit A
VLLGSVIILAGLSIVAPFAQRALGRWTGLALAAGPAGVFIWLASQLATVASGDAVVEATPWVPGLGVELSFHLDGLALLFALLITGIGTLIVLYASEYLKGHPLQGRFYGYLLGFMMSMVGLVTADNILLLFIFWELTSITSYLLIGFDHDKAEARKSALQALVVTGLGGLAMLAGVILLAIMAGGEWNLSTILATEGLTEHALWPAALTCLLLGAFTKSAQFPFHFWLPNAMAAPTPVSAYLHSSTMVKAGVYLVMRLNPAFLDDPLWSWMLAGFGGTTMVVGALLATRETQFKKVLAYSTVSSLGIMVMFTGLSGTAVTGDSAYAEYGAKAAVAYLLAHALFKACLFLVAGTVTHETGVKDVEKLGGLFGSMKVTAVCGLVGGLSMAGVPPLFGFVGKELMLKAGLHPSGIGMNWAGVVTAAVFFSAALTVMVSFMVGYRPFFSPRRPEVEEVHAHEPPMIMRLGPLVLAALTILVPWAPGLFAGDLVGAAITSVAGVADHAEGAYAAAGHSLTLVAGDASASGSGHGVAAKIAIWDVFHPFTMAFALSVLAIGLGLALYANRAWWRGTYGAMTRLIDPIGPERNYHRLFDGTMSFANWQTRVLQNGLLRVYIKVTLVSTSVLLGLTLWRAWSEGFFNFDAVVGNDFAFLEVVLLSMTGLAAVICTQYRSRLATVAALGVVGYGVAMTFVLLGVPDIAMTQFAIETLTVVIFVLVVYHLPRFNLYSSSATRLSDSLVAAVFGAAASLLVLLAADEQVPFARISDWMGQHSYTDAYGRNVVNVILVDFRGMDTMGEIVVLGLAALGVYTLLRLRGGEVSELSGGAKLDPRNLEDVVGTGGRP